MAVTAQDIQAALHALLQPDELAVQDDSHLHAGHAGAREGRHFSVRIVSARFAGMPRVALATRVILPCYAVNRFPLAMCVWLF